MNNEHETRSRSDSETPTVYTIHIGALLGREWIGWFDDAEIVARDDGTCTITIPIRDQAMLFGILIRIRDLGVPLLGLFPGRLT